MTDALVAVSNPGAFQLARVPEQSDVIDTETLTSRRRTAVRAIPLDPWMWGSYGLDSYRYGNPYGYRYGYGGYGYGNGYGYNNGYYGGYAPPIIIVTDARVTPVGQMVKGRGYTQPGGSSTGATARERPSQASAPSPTPSSSSGSSSGGSSSGSSSSGSSEGRTAKPRP